MVFHVYEFFCIQYVTMFKKVQLIVSVKLTNAKTKTNNIFGINNNSFQNCVCRKNSILKETQFNLFRFR